MNPDNDVIEVHLAKDGWRWRRLDRNNEKIVAESGEAYVNYSRAHEAARALNPGLKILTD